MRTATKLLLAALVLLIGVSRLNAADLVKGRKSLPELVLGTAGDKP